MSKSWMIAHTDRSFINFSSLPNISPGNRVNASFSKYIVIWRAAESVLSIWPILAPEALACGWVEISTSWSYVNTNTVWSLVLIVSTFLLHNTHSKHNIVVFLTAWTETLLINFSTIRRNLLTVSLDTHLICSTTLFLQAAFSFVVFVPALNTFMTVLCDQVILLTIQKRACTWPIAQPLSFLATCKRVDYTQTFSILNSHVRMLTADTISSSFIILITKRWNLDAKEAIFWRNLSWRANDLLTNSQRRRPPPKDTLHTSSLSLEEQSTFLRNIQTFFVDLILIFWAVDHDRLTCSIILKFVVINTRSANSTCDVISLTETWYILTGIVDLILPIFTHHRNFLADSILNSAGIDFARQAETCKGIVCVAGITYRQTFTKLEVIPFRTGIIVVAGAIYQSIASKAS